MKKATISLFLTVILVRGACPTPAVAYSWNSTIITYTFGNVTPVPCWTLESFTTLGVANDIHAAFGQWTYADQNQNSTNRGFYSGAGAVPFTVDANRVADPASCGTSVAAQTAPALYAGTNIVAFANTTFYFGSTSSLGYPNWDEGAASFNDFVRKVMAHEIGHTMGVDDQPLGGGVCGGQTAGESVMNAQCGTNDSANNMPGEMFGLPNCDNASVH